VLQASGPVIAATDAALWIVLLTGGGLAIIGTVVGAFVTYASNARLGRETRREARRVAVKSFQRDALVALQQAVVELFEATGPVLFDLARQAEGHEPTDVEAQRAVNNAVITYNICQLRVRMLASRIRDDTLRAAAHDFLDAHEEIVEEDPFDHGQRGEGEQT
jgi:hypothetical protein